MMASKESNKSRKKTAAYTEESLIKALTAIRENKASVRQVCRDYGIPKSTILDRIHGKTTDILKKRGPDPVLGTDGEEKIVNWLINISKCGFPVKKQELLDSVQKIVRDSSIPNKFKDCRPGQKWYLNFLKRNPQISCRSAESINKARAQVSEESIRNWFCGLETYLEEINQKDILNRPSSIFNGDESGFALCPKTGKVLGPRGYRSLYQVKQGNEKDNLTVLVTFNANGDVCPPCVVFPYVKPPQAVVKSMPPDWCLGKSESGRMRGDVFFEYITNDFNNWLERNNIIKPVLLLVDGHKSYMSLMLCTICEQLNIILYALPPNTTHIFQPADVSVFAPLKASWKNTVRNFLMKPENINKTVTKTNFCKLFAETLQETNLATYIQNGFKRCGLYPFDPNALDYTKCVIDTMQNIKTRQSTPGTGISRADVATTKKVLKQLKTALLNKKVNYRVLMEELNLFKKTLPVETNVCELSLDTESDYNSTVNGSRDSSQVLSNSASFTVTDLLKESEDSQLIQPTPDSTRYRTGY
ncbi:unnamed protein product [Colias eurytheme]|nr:unnamed protein product [Colias eurytheme]